MATRITMPQLGESVTEGTVTRWIKHEGEWVNRDEPFVEIMTDKVNAEVPSPVAGVLVKASVPEGTKLSVGEELAVIDENMKQGERLAERTTSGNAAVGLPPTRPGPVEEPRGDGEADRESIANGPEGPGHASPIVRRLAREHGIDLAGVPGTGIGGRVTKDDVLRFVASRPDQGARATAASAVAATSFAPPALERPVEPASRGLPAPAQTREPAGDEVVVPTPMRLAIAEHMVRSVQTAPHAWTVFEVDMTRLVRWRDQIKAQFEEREGVALTYLPFVIKAVVGGLRDMPILNAAWVDNRIVLKRDVNIGIAVALEDGLIVPVLRNADSMSIAGIAKVTSDLTARARAGRLTPRDVQGGTFTVNNPGAFGSIVSMPIINQGQAGILAIESIVKRPVVVDDAIAIRSMMNLGLSFDHRVIDGLTAGKFLQHVKRRLESYGPDTALY